MTDWISLIKELGFPVVITLYILIRLEGAVKDLTAAIIKLDTYIQAKLGGTN